MKFKKIRLTVVAIGIVLSIFANNRLTVKAEGGFCLNCSQPIPQIDMQNFEAEVNKLKQENGNLYLVLGEYLHADHAPARFSQPNWLFLDSCCGILENMKKFKRIGIYGYPRALSMISCLRGKLSYIVDDAEVLCSCGKYPAYPAQGDEAARIALRSALDCLESNGKLMTSIRILSSLTQDQLNELFSQYDIFAFQNRKNFAKPYTDLPFYKDALVDLSKVEEIDLKEVEFQGQNWTPPVINLSNRALSKLDDNLLKKLLDPISQSSYTFKTIKEELDRIDENKLDKPCKGTLRHLKRIFEQSRIDILNDQYQDIYDSIRLNNLSNIIRINSLTKCKKIKINFHTNLRDFIDSLDKINYPDSLFFVKK